jgi:hypothetical protein
LDASEFEKLDTSLDASEFEKQGFETRGGQGESLVPTD